MRSDRSKGRPGGGDGLWVPAGRDSVGIRQVIVVGDFLAGLAMAVSTDTGFVLGDLDEIAVPIDSFGLKVCYFATTEAEPTHRADRLTALESHVGQANRYRPPTAVRTRGRSARLGSERLRRATEHLVESTLITGDSRKGE